MKKEVDRLYQHAIIPVLLGLASITLVVALYFCSEWLVSSGIPHDASFYAYGDEVSSQAYRAKVGQLMALFFLAAAICIAAVIVQRRLMGLVAIVLGVCSILYIVL
ncbi:hypothetical protein DN752_10395 [Echinicola strongylocentroti]|uniref:Uncharacterized protein n=1 Tax=Echinicola strongylocentroti TaxID=1795355 RepID=A0A2Z4III2_9BACT|nr:hypothetical protein [Echinicola strongylocentroti]AWW30500.1 hypothetical protein DN752_10395 [Echinicola strongylocentroti]